MCLIIKKGQRYRIAKEDIPCYKIIKKLIYRVGYSEDTIYSYIYCSPYQARRISNAEVEGKIPYDAYTPFTGGFLINGERAIGAGAIHTYAKLYNPLLISAANESLEEYKCIIPKGTKYYVGKDQSGCESYASERIIFKEKLS